MLASAGVLAEGHAPPVDEAAILHPDPVSLARLRAIGKARSVAALRPDAVIIGADQVCWLPAEADVAATIFHKPTDDVDHLRQLVRLQGRAHTLSSAVCVCVDGVEHVVVEHSVVHLRPASDAELAGYITTGEGRACAGGYQVEGRGAWLIERIEGDWFNVVGLPLFRVLSLLRQLGIDPPFVHPAVALARAAGMT